MIAIALTLGASIRIAVASDWQQPVPTLTSMLEDGTDRPELIRAPDLDALVRRTHLAFFPFHGEFVGGDDLYAVRVARDVVSIRPDAPSVHTPSVLRLRTRSVYRGAEKLSRDGQYVRDHDGSLIRELSPTILERLHNTPNGLEQSWEITRKPEGSGDLVIVVSTAGTTLRGDGNKLRRYVDPASGLGLVYSDATWLAADGRSTPLQVTSGSQALTIRVPAVLLESARYPVVLDPNVAQFESDEQETGPDATPTPSLQLNPAVAYSGGTWPYYAVWQDRHRKIDMTYDIFGVTLNSDGVPQDYNSVQYPAKPAQLVSEPETTGNNTDPSISWSSSKQQYVVTFTTDRHGYHEIWTCSVAAGGTPVCATTSLSGNSSTQDATGARITKNFVPSGNEFLVAWKEAPLSGNADPVTYVRASFFHDDKTMSAISSRFVVSGLSGATPFGVAVATNGSAANSANTSTVVWSDNRSVRAHIYGQVYSSTHAPLLVTNGALLASLTGNQNAPSVASLGRTGDWIVAFHQTPSPLHDYIYAVRYSYNGSTIGSPFTIAGSGFANTPAAGQGVGVVLSWVDNGHLKAAQYNSVSGLQPVVSLRSGANGVSSTPAIIGNASTKYVVLWSDRKSYVESGLDDIVSNNVEPSTGVVQCGGYSNCDVSIEGNPGHTPFIAKWRTDTFVTWTDGKYGDEQQNVFTNGSECTGPTESLQSGGYTALGVSCTQFFSSGQTYPACATAINRSGTLYFGFGSLYCGATLFPTFSAVTDSSASVSCTTNGTCLLVWSNGGAILAQQFDLAQYAPIGTTQTIAAADGSLKAYPHLAFDGTSYLIVWQNKASGASWDIVARSYTPAGALGTQFTVDANAADQRYPRVAFDESGGQATVVYEDDRNLATNGTDVYLSRITSTGVVGGPAAVASGAADELSPQLDTRVMTTQEVVYTTQARNTVFESDVWAVTVTGGVAATPYAISTATDVRERSPVVACPTASLCDFVYEAFSPQANAAVFGVDRIKIRGATYP